MTEHAQLRLQSTAAATIARPDLPAAAEEPLCAPAAPLDLKDLVDAPCRTLESEYKSWRNFDTAEDQAELARDVAALANIGGGTIAFGFNEETLVPTDSEPFGTVCTQERIDAIVATYLDPPPRCELHHVRSASGDMHLVIRVSGHGITPVCVRYNGPLTNSGRLLERSAVYIRRHARSRGRLTDIPRAESARIEVPQDWAKLIRRCVRQDREALLSAIEATLADREPPSSVHEQLFVWHRAARAAFLALVPRSPAAERLARCHYALSYAVDLQRPQLLDHAQLPEFLQRCAFANQNLFRRGPRLFEPPYRLGVRPRFVTDPTLGDDETDFLETTWLRAYPPTEMTDLWRVSPKGFATIVRDYGEDRREVNLSLDTEPGTWISADLLASELAELVCHARHIAGFYAAARRVVFRCEWWGLAGRVLRDPEARWPQTGVARGDHRAVSLDVSVAALANTWADVVSRLMAPVLRALEPDLRLGADWVWAQLPRWRGG